MDEWKTRKKNHVYVKNLNLNFKKFLEELYDFYSNRLVIILCFGQHVLSLLNKIECLLKTINDLVGHQLIKR